MGQSSAPFRVLVTAAAAGIGRAIAAAFMHSGASVHVCDLSEALLVDFKAAHSGLGVTRADVSDPVQVERLFQEVEAQLGGLDILVNNVGVSGPTAAVDEVSIADWQSTLAVNLNSHFYCMRKAVPLLKAAGGGSIVSISSTAGLTGYPVRPIRGI